MKYYEVDLTGVSTRDELHDRLLAGLELQEPYGRNLDALRDVLTSLEVPCTITLYGFKEASGGDMGDYLQSMKKVCNDAVKEIPGLTFEWEPEGIRPQVDASGKKLPKVRPQRIEPTESPFYTKCYVCGKDNPDGLHLPLRFMDGIASTEFIPDDKMIGLVTKTGSLMHGGFTSMVFDEVMTYVMMGRGLQTVTLTMTVNYVSPARTGHKMKAEAWLERREGKKLWAAAKLADEVTGEIVATATGLYYQVDLAAFIDGIDAQ